MTLCQLKKITNMVFTQDFWNQGFYGHGKFSSTHADMDEPKSMAFSGCWKL
jgi:hypothetical protein